MSDTTKKSTGVKVFIWILIAAVAFLLWRVVEMDDEISSKTNEVERLISEKNSLKDRVNELKTAPPNDEDSPFSSDSPSTPSEPPSSLGGGSTDDLWDNSLTDEKWEGGTTDGGQDCNIIGAMTKPCVPDDSDRKTMDELEREQQDMFQDYLDQGSP